MTYSLFDVFLVWFSPWWPLALVVITVGSIGWFVCWRLCVGINRRSAKRIQEIEDHEKAWQAELKQRSEWYERDAKARQAWEFERNRIKNAQARCLANSTRTRYSKATLGKKK